MNIEYILRPPFYVFFTYIKKELTIFFYAFLNIFLVPLSINIF